MRVEVLFRIDFARDFLLDQTCSQVLFAVNEVTFCVRAPRLSTGLALLPQVALTCALATMMTSSNWRLLVPTGELDSLAKSHLALLSTGREPADYAAGKYVGAPGISPGQTRHVERITDPSPPPLYLQYSRTGLEKWDAKFLVGKYGAELASWGARGAGKDFVIWATDPAQDCASESKSWRRVPFMCVSTCSPRLFEIAHSLGKFCSPAGICVCIYIYINSSQICV